jgi:hypothetical protein
LVGTRLFTSRRSEQSIHLSKIVNDLEKTLFTIITRRMESVGPKPSSRKMQIVCCWAHKSSMIRILLLFIAISLPNSESRIHRRHYYHGRGHHLSGTRWNTGMTSFTGWPGAGNIGWGNDVAAFYLVCHTCNRAGG